MKCYIKEYDELVELNLINPSTGEDSFKKLLETIDITYNYDEKHKAYVITDKEYNGWKHLLNKSSEYLLSIVSNS